MKKRASEKDIAYIAAEHQASLMRLAAAMAAEMRDDSDSTNTELIGSLSELLEEYQTLRQKAEKKGELIGIICQRDPEVDVPLQDDLHEIGVYAKVMKLLTLPNGNITAIVQCYSRLRLLEITQSLPHLEGLVEPLTDIEPEKRDREFKTAMDDLRNMVNEYINVSEEIPDEATFAIKNISNNIMALNFVCSNLPFSIKEKIRLLEMESVKERLFNVMKIINREINLQNLKADIRNKTREDIDEQQRNYFLQQQYNILRRCPDYGQYAVQRHCDRMVPEGKAAACARTGFRTDLRCILPDNDRRYQAPDVCRNAEYDSDRSMGPDRKPAERRACRSPSACF